MNGWRGLVGRSRPRWRKAGIGRPDRFDRAVRQPDQVEGLRIVARREPVRGLRDDGNTTLKAGILRGIGLEIGGERAQLVRDDVADEIFRRLTIKGRVRKGRVRDREIAGSALEGGLEALPREVLRREGLRREGLRLQAQQKRHQISQQAYELLNVR